MWGLGMWILMLLGERRIELLFMVWKPWSPRPTLNSGDECCSAVLVFFKIPAGSTRGCVGVVRFKTGLAIANAYDGALVHGFVVLKQTCMKPGRNCCLWVHS